MTPSGRHLTHEIGFVEVFAYAGLVRVTTTGEGTKAKAIAYLKPDDANRLADLVRGAALVARGTRMELPGDQPG